MKLNCPKCKEVEVIMEEKVFPSGIKHIGCYCSKCGRWIKWISKKEFEWEERVKKFKKQ